MSFCLCATSSTYLQYICCPMVVFRHLYIGRKRWGQTMESCMLYTLTNLLQPMSDRSLYILLAWTSDVALWGLWIKSCLQLSSIPVHNHLSLTSISHTQSNATVYELYLLTSAHNNADKNKLSTSCALIGLRWCLSAAPTLPQTNQNTESLRHCTFIQ